MTEYTKPLPVMTELSRRFYEGCKNNQLLYQKCRDCGEVIFFPKRTCSNCMGRNLGWQESSGKGKIFSFTVTYDAAPPEFMPHVPFVLAVVTLEEGFNILTNIEECDFDDIRCDMPVQVKFDPVTSEVTLPKFIPIDKTIRKVGI